MLLMITIGSLVTTVGLLVLLILFRKKEYRRMDRIREMLSAAVEGTFLQKEYDETYLSAIEMQMAQYLHKSESVLKKMDQHQDKISSLISDISHQTKTPLANISLYTELLLEKELSQEAENCAKQIQTQAEKLQFLIGALVQTSRLENGIIKLDPMEHCVEQMIQNAVDQVQMKAGDKKIIIKNKNGHGIFDEKWTQEAFYNLLDNAVKYSMAGDHIEVNTTSYEMFLRIDVTDHGPGIPEDEQAKIFGRFYRGENARHKEGLGIGLYLSDQILNGEGGYLKVKSMVGRGTTFSMFLPKSNRDPERSKLSKLLVSGKSQERSM